MAPARKQNLFNFSVYSAGNAVLETRKLRRYSHLLGPRVPSLTALDSEPLVNRCSPAHVFRDSPPMKPHGVEFNAAANEPSHHRCRGASMAVMGQNLSNHSDNVLLRPH